MKKNENTSGDQLASANSQIQFFDLVNQNVHESDKMLDENGDHVENTFVVLDEETKNKNLFTITADLPANVAANIAIGEIVVPEFIETSSLPKDSNHILSVEDLEMNDSNVGSGVHSDLEILETIDETENLKKKSSAASLRANPLYLCYQ